MDLLRLEHALMNGVRLEGPHSVRSDLAAGGQVTVIADFASYSELDPMPYKHWGL
jgi:hypothetical protein